MKRPAVQSFHKGGRPRPDVWAKAESICQAYQNGATLTELGVEHDCSSDCVRKIVAHNNIPIVLRPRRPVNRNLAGNQDIPASQFVHRDPCPNCNTRRDIGCRHYPLEAAA